MSMPERLCLEELVDRLGRGQAERLVGGEFRHEVVVVGVEPLGHLGGRRAFAVMRVAMRAAFMRTSPCAPRAMAK